MTDVSDADSPLVTALRAAQERQETHREAERLMEKQLGSSWRECSPDEVRVAAIDIAASLGTPERSEEIREAAERSALAVLVMKTLDATMPGLERPVPREVWERAFIEAADARYGGMPAVAIDVGLAFGLRDPSVYEPKEDRVIPDE